MNEKVEELTKKYKGQDVLLVLDREQTAVGVVNSELEDWDCGVEGCTALNYEVNWEDGETTIVCGGGLSWITEEIGHIL